MGLAIKGVDTVQFLTAVTARMAKLFETDKAIERLTEINVVLAGETPDFNSLPSFSVSWKSRAEGTSRIHTRTAQGILELTYWARIDPSEPGYARDYLLRVKSAVERTLAKYKQPLGLVRLAPQSAILALAPGDPRVMTLRDEYDCLIA